MASKSPPTRPKGIQPTFEFVDGAPLTVEQKAKVRSKVRSNARKWQISQRRVSAGGSTEATETPSAPARPPTSTSPKLPLSASSQSPTEYTPLQRGHSNCQSWNHGSTVPGVFVGAGDTSDHSSPESGGESWATDSQVLWYSSTRTSRESSPLTAIAPTGGFYDSIQYNLAAQDLYAEAGCAPEPDTLESKALISWSAIDDSRPAAAQGWVEEDTGDEQWNVIGPINLLGAGQVDPFMTYPSKLSDVLVGKYIDVLVRGPLRSATGGKASLRAPTAVIASAMSNPMLFHTLMFSAASYNLASQGILNRDGPSDIVYSEGEAVKYVNKMISNPKTACLDITIHVVLFLANIGIDPTAKRGRFKAPRQGPLQDLQCLNVYGTYEMRAAHRQGLVTLLKMRGGLDTFGPNRVLPGLISYVDIMSAVILLAKPTMQYVSMTRGVGRANLDFPTGWFAQPRLPLYYLAEGFHTIWQHPHSPVSNLLKVIEDMQHFTIVLDKHHDKLDQLDLALMADHRNWIQYRMCSLLGARLELCDIGGLYDQCRIAANIYCLIVVFPYPASKAPFDQLALRLRDAMTANAAAVYESAEVSLWVATLGGIAAVGVPKERAWFARTVRNCLAVLQLSTWVEMKTVLQLFLWYERVNDEDGRTLFRESEQLLGLSKAAGFEAREADKFVMTAR